VPTAGEIRPAEWWTRNTTMSHDYAQRRRVALAAAITVIAAPAAFLLNRGGDEPGAVTGVTVVGAPDGAAEPAPATAPAATDAMGTTPVAYLDGTAAPRDGESARIAIPRLPQAVTGTASFRRNITSVTTCQAKGVPFNSAVTVTNLDNSRSVQCIASVGGPEPDDDVILHADAFLQIADLTDAPVPVQISW
jgi:hypothetical protein